jgi:transcriptional regulator with XRE-family HTH domain
MTEPDVINQRIGAAIRAARGRRGITQDELAPRLGVGRATLARYETGQRTLSAAMLVHICHILGESLDSLLPGLTTTRSDPGAPILSEPMQRIVQHLQRQPELIPTVEDLLATMAAAREEYPG